MTIGDIRDAVHFKLLQLGWRVERAPKDAGMWEAHRAYWSPAYLRRHGFAPRTIIDVGVGQGTPDLYNAFPQAYLVLVEPLAEFNGAVDAILKARRGEKLAAALGAAGQT